MKKYYLLLQTICLTVFAVVAAGNFARSQNEITIQHGT